jgi:hypothetical protein
LAYGSPLRALSVAANGGAMLAHDMGELLEALAGQGRDLISEAERWVKAGAAERVRWVEFWAARTVREAQVREDSHSLGTRALQSTTQRRHIQSLFAVHDRAREATGWLQRGSVNAQLLVEGLLLDLVRAVRSRPAEGNIS